MPKIRNGGRPLCCVASSSCPPAGNGVRRDAAARTAVSSPQLPSIWRACRAGKLDARLLPTPSLRLRSVVVGGANDLGKGRADKLDVEFSLGSLMRGEWRADKLTINGLALDLGLDSQGRIDWPASSGKFNLGSLAIDRLNLTGRIALHDAASRSTLQLNDIAFSGDVRSLAGSVRGAGTFMLARVHYPSP